MGQTELIEQRGQEYPANSAVEVLEGMNPLKPPVGPGEELSRAPDESARIMPKAFGEIVAELPHVYRHFIVGRRKMGSDLHIHIAKTSGPIWKQMSGQPFMPLAQPFGIDDDLIGLGLKNVVVDADEWNGEAFGEFCVGETAFSGLELASGT